MGAYILIAKVVSVLSSLGISLGGTATVAAFVASIGGPVVIGISLAILSAVATFGIFTGKWKDRVAKKRVKTYNSKKICCNYLDAIEDYWKDTEHALDACITSLNTNIEEYYNEKISFEKMTAETRYKTDALLDILYKMIVESYSKMIEKLS